MILSVSGCIRDKIEPCPPLSVTLTVRDKNWSNIGEVAAEGLAEPKDEDLPFREFVQTLSYELIDLQSGDVVYSSEYEVTHDNVDEVLTFDESLPFGQYELNVWGNADLAVSKSSLAADGLDLHEEGDWGADNVYHYTGILDYDYDKASYMAGLERTVGCLLIDAVNIPEEMDYSVKDVSRVYGTVRKGFLYDAPETVHTELDWEDSKSSIRTETCLGPTPEGQESLLEMTFRDMDLYEDGKSGWPYEITPDAVKMKMERNRMTVIRYDYDVNGMRVMILVNGQWEILHDMIID